MSTYDHYVPYPELLESIARHRHLHLLPRSDLLHMQRQASSAARVKGCCSRFLWLQMFKLHAFGVGRTVTNHDRAFEEV
jgi:hypothetical protein